MTKPAAAPFPSLPITIRDDEGRDHTLTKPLGQGSQGIVFETANPEIAVKLHARASDTTRTSLRDIRLLPLSGLPMARPLSTITGEYDGYTMQVQPELQPWSSLWDAPDQGLERWWIETGGLRRRLSLSTSLAGTMAALSAMGITYGDLSPSNALVTAPTAAAQGCVLIDLDNLRQGPGPTIGTPRFAAPELNRSFSRRTPPVATTSLTDAWSLAVLVFGAICQVHPMLGSTILNGPPEGEEGALAGDLPWIDDHDTTNANPKGMPRSDVLTKSVRERFAEMFGAGRQDPNSRPTAGSLLRALEEQLYLLAPCVNCHTDWVARGQCLTCRRPLSGYRLWQIQSVPFGARERAADDHPMPSAWLAAPEGQSLEPPRRLVAYGSGQPPVRIEMRHDEVAVTRLASDPVYVTEGARAAQEIAEHARTFRADRGLVIHVGHHDDPHRLLVLQRRI